MDKAVIITIGDELLIGQTIDTNSAWMGQELSKIGIDIEEKIAIKDTKEGIIRGLERGMEQADIILITGGLGPTQDDITKEVLTEYFEMQMRFDQPTFDRIEMLFKRWGRPMNPSHKQQCYMPDGCTLLENKMGTAPGMEFNIKGKTIISMPGVPYEMKYIMEKNVLPKLKNLNIGKALVHHTIMTAGEGESRIAKRIDYILNKFPSNISIAYLPSLGSVRLRLTAIGNDEALLKSEVLKFSKQISTELGQLVYGYDEISLSDRIGELAKKQNLTIGTAESCTGGLVASKLVETPGSSTYYQGSIVSYSYDLKKQLLSVNPDTLLTYGAVSEEVVIQMVEGLIETTGVDIGLSISGIAGPGGGTDDKPVGTAWIACGRKGDIKTLKILAGKDRVKNIEYTANYAMNFMRLYLEGMQADF